jgi:hypothetical protein
MREIYKYKVTAFQIHEIFFERALEPNRSSFLQISQVFSSQKGRTVH